MGSPTTLSILSLSLILFLFLSLPSPTLSSSGDRRHRCNPQDKKVLLQIKQSLHNPYHLASWDPDTDCCGWYCLQCDLNTNRVIELTIFSGQISGQIPAAVGDLPYLERLMFRKLTNLTGNIPEAITKLTRLKSLSLSWTNLSGSVPPFLSKLKTLTYLDLSFNNLTGSIPSSLSELPNLEAIHLDRNKLTGTIPDSFGSFAGRVPELYLSHNLLSGSVPKSLGRLDFPTIDLSRNRLVGDARFLFGSKKTLWKLDLSRNLFEFDISGVEVPATLAWLDLNHNKISGSLPSGLKGASLQFLNVTYNRLCGSIPAGGALQSFDYSSYFHNRCLCGSPLPACK